MPSPYSGHVVPDGINLVTVSLQHLFKNRRKGFYSLTCSSSNEYVVIHVFTSLITVIMRLLNTNSAHFFAFCPFLLFFSSLSDTYAFGINGNALYLKNAHHYGDI